MLSKLILVCIGAALSACGPQTSTPFSHMQTHEKNPPISQTSYTRDGSTLPSASVPSAPAPRALQRISARGLFAFTIPKDMVKLRILGMDSYHEAYRNDRMVIGFDFGRYCARAESPDEIIGGKAAQITTETIDSIYEGRRYTHFAVVEFKDIGEGINGLVMHAYANNASDIELAKTIFRSIKFRN